jgi:cytochrome c553
LPNPFAKPRIEQCTFVAVKQYGLTSVERGTQAYQADLNSIVAALLFSCIQSLGGIVCSAQVWQFQCEGVYGVEVCKSMLERLLARTLATVIFLGTAGSLGLGQVARSSAASTYKTNCVSCHGPDGRGSAVGKSLHAADFHSAQVKQQSEAQLANVIAEGRGNMPAFGTRLSKDQISALVKYIRTLAKTK